METDLRRNAVEELKAKQDEDGDKSKAAIIEDQKEVSILDMIQNNYNIQKKIADEAIGRMENIKRLCPELFVRNGSYVGEGPSEQEEEHQVVLVGLRERMERVEIQLLADTEVGPGCLLARGNVYGDSPSVTECKDARQIGTDVVRQNAAEGKFEPNTMVDTVSDIKDIGNGKSLAKRSYVDVVNIVGNDARQFVAESTRTQGARQNGDEGNSSTHLSELVSDIRTLGNGMPLAKRSYAAVVNNAVKENSRYDLSTSSRPSNLKLKYFTSEEGPVVLTPEKEALEKLNKCVVGYFLGGRLGFLDVEVEIKRQWSKLKTMKRNEKGFYFFDFQDESCEGSNREGALLYIW